MAASSKKNPLKVKPRIATASIKKVKPAKPVAKDLTATAKKKKLDYFC